jgi:hypothetical protein
MQHKKIVHFLLGVAALAALAALLAGCATNIEPSPADPTRPLTPVPTTGQPVQDTMEPEATVEEVKHFNICVTAEGSDLAESVKHSVEGRLADEGYKLTDAAPDIRVRLSVDTSVFDRAGGAGYDDTKSVYDHPDNSTLKTEYSGYVRYQGTVNADITRVWGHKKIGFVPISVRGKRGLGDDEAKRNLTAQLVDQATPVIVNAARPELTGLAVKDVIIHRPWLQSHDITPNLTPGGSWVSTSNPEYAQHFVQAVSGMPGVIYCAMVAENYGNSTMTFRVVYLADAMPAGLINGMAGYQDFKKYHFKQ